MTIIENKVTRTIETSFTTLISKTCDICGFIQNMNGNLRPTDEFENCWPVEKVKLERRPGGRPRQAGETVVSTVVKIQFEGYTQTDENGDHETKHDARAYHICPSCFKDKLEPWLQAQGAKPTLENWQY